MIAIQRRSRRVVRAGLVMALVAAAWVGGEVAAPAHAATNQLHGVNWADPRDNFAGDALVPVGLSAADGYAATFAKATTIIKGFQTIGANTIRVGINPVTTSSAWWSSLIGAFDAADALGVNVMITPWPIAVPVGTDTSAFYAMWDVVINKYGSNSRFYFDLVNEPSSLSPTRLTDLAAGFLARYPAVPRGRIVIPGVYNDQNLAAVGADPRLAGTLLSIHLYSMFGTTHSTEQGWIDEFTNNLAGYADRAVLTEFGVPMNTGVNYNGARDGVNDLSYLYAMTDTVRKLGMGSILWTGVQWAGVQQGPGPCESGSCAIMNLHGTGTDLSLTVTNQSGLDRLRYGWGIG